MKFDPPSPYVIAGIKAGWNPDDPSRRRPVRRRIDEWFTSTVQEDKDQVYLFVHALLFWQGVDPDLLLSYFPIAGLSPLTTSPMIMSLRMRQGFTGYHSSRGMNIPNQKHRIVATVLTIVYCSQPGTVHMSCSTRYGLLSSTDFDQVLF